MASRRSCALGQDACDGEQFLAKIAARRFVGAPSPKNSHGGRYQSIFGAWPLDGPALLEFVGRPTEISAVFCQPVAGNHNRRNGRGDQHEGSGSIAAARHPRKRSRVRRSYRGREASWHRRSGSISRVMMVTVQITNTSAFGDVGEEYNLFGARVADTKMAPLAVPANRTTGCHPLIFLAACWRSPRSLRGSCPRSREAALPRTVAQLPEDALFMQRLLAEQQAAVSSASGHRIKL